MLLLIILMWIYYSLCLREMKINKLNWSDRIHLINKYLILKKNLKVLKIR